MSEQNPWQTRGTRIVYENPWMRVREEDVIRPDGKPGIYAYVEKSLAVGAVAVNGRGEVMLVGQYRYPTKRYSWEIVEGGAEAGEDGLSAAKRELQEEAGLSADSWEQLGGEVELSNCVTAEIAVFYLARGMKEIAATPEGTEVLSLKWVPFDEALRMVHSGEIRDAMSVIGLLRAQRALENSGSRPAGS